MLPVLHTLTRNETNIRAGPVVSDPTISDVEYHLVSRPSDLSRAKWLHLVSSYAYFRDDTKSFGIMACES